MSHIGTTNTCLSWIDIALKVPLLNHRPYKYLCVLFLPIELNHNRFVQHAPIRDDRSKERNSDSSQVNNTMNRALTYRINRGKRHHAGKRTICRENVLYSFLKVYMYTKYTDETGKYRKGGEHSTSAGTSTSVFKFFYETLCTSNTVSVG